MATESKFTVTQQAGGVFVVSCNGGRTVAAVSMSERKASAAARKMNKAGA